MAQDDRGHIWHTAIINFNIVFVACLVKPVVFREMVVIRFRNSWPIFVSMFSLYGGLNQTMFLLRLLIVFVAFASFRYFKLISYPLSWRALLYIGAVLSNSFSDDESWVRWSFTIDGICFFIEGG